MEVVWYNRTLTPNEQSRVNTYLAVKNGVTLAEDYLSSDRSVLWNRSTNTGYHSKSFGVAADNTSGLHKTQTTSTSPKQHTTETQSLLSQSYTHQRLQKKK